MAEGFPWGGSCGTRQIPPILLNQFGKEDQLRESLVKRKIFLQVLFATSKNRVLLKKINLKCTQQVYKCP